VSALNPEPFDSREDDAAGFRSEGAERYRAGDIDEVRGPNPESLSAHNDLLDHIEQRLGLERLRLATMGRVGGWQFLGGVATHQDKREAAFDELIYNWIRVFAAQVNINQG
jgi:hypothetical protein